jgi:hypothetical protein
MSLSTVQIVYEMNTIEFDFEVKDTRRREIGQQVGD